MEKICRPDSASPKKKTACSSSPKRSDLMLPDFQGWWAQCWVCSWKGHSHVPSRTWSHSWRQHPGAVPATRSGSALQSACPVWAQSSCKPRVHWLKAQSILLGLMHWEKFFPWYVIRRSKACNDSLPISLDYCFQYWPENWWELPFSC